MIMISRATTSAFALGFSLLALAGCSNDPTLTGTSVPNNFVQIDRVGQPALNTIFTPFAQHDANDRGTPSGDVQNLGAAISTFMTETAGRSAATASAAQTLLLANNADVLSADLTQSGNAGYLGLETGAKIGTAFGGRSLTDDVMSTQLGIVFGNRISTLGLAPDDGKENNGQNGTPQLSTDNVSSAPVAPTLTFPYLAAPQ
jgi:hypothetical protein